tara:strand:- start:1210 stop:1722 length:513 start_codon:yes stop_codon:yes gene_type:complete
MANKKSAKQEILVNKRNQDRNNHYKSMMRTSIKKTRAYFNPETQPSNSETEGLTQLRSTLKLIDKLVSKQIHTKETAARIKSRLSKQFIQLVGPISNTAAPKTEKSTPSKETSKKSTTTKSTSSKKESSKKTSAKSDSKKETAKTESAKTAKDVKKAPKKTEAKAAVAST